MKSLAEMGCPQSLIRAIQIRVIHMVSQMQRQCRRSRRSQSLHLVPWDSRQPLKKTNKQLSIYTFLIGK